MRQKYFFDTNILIYALDASDKKKQADARRLIAEHARKACISTQVLQEFFVAATKKLGISPLKAKELTQKLGGFHCVQVTADLVFEAMDIAVINKISYWDSLIVAAAAASGCAVILSEDMRDGQKISGVAVQNPFR